MKALGLYTHTHTHTGIFRKLRISKNLMLLMAITIAVMVMGIGYSAINSITGEITGNILAEAQEGVFITDVENVSNVDANMTNSKIENLTKTTLKSIVELSNTNPLSSITYKVTVYNSSKDIYKFTEVKYDKEFYDNEAITFEITGFIPEQKIQPNETKEILITFKYKDTTAVPANRILNSYLNFNMEVFRVTTAGTYLPDGFTQVEGTDLYNGLTIQDSTGNQYVWVEVPKTAEVYTTAGLSITAFTKSEYTAIENDLHTYTNDYRNGTRYKDEYYSDATTGLTSERYTALKQKMLKSVYQNGGFYVGKYETGIEDTPKTSGSSSTVPTETPVIKQNAYPYNNVTCSQAQALASGMVKSENYTSGLMFGVQRDLVLKYLETKGTAQADLKTNSTRWGNYANNLWNITNANSKYAILNTSNYTLGDWTSGAYGTKGSSKEILLSTGASDTFSKQGIYDLAGNVWEWTLEYTSYSSIPCATRGGSFYYDGSNNPAADRSSYYTTGCIYDIGFRVALY